HTPPDTLQGPCQTGAALDARHAARMISGLVAKRALRTSPVVSANRPSGSGDSARNDASASATSTTPRAWIATSPTLPIAASTRDGVAAVPDRSSPDVDQVASAGSSSAGGGSRLPTTSE